MAIKIPSAVLLLLFSFCPKNSLSAQKFDNRWLFGFNNITTTVKAESFDLVFDTFPPRVELSDRQAYMLKGGAYICDSAGVTQYYTNNCQIWQGDAKLVMGADSLTTEPWEIEWCRKYRDHPYVFYTLFLPSSRNKDRIFFFNKSTIETSFPIYQIYQTNFRYSVIQKDSNGNSKRIIKDKKLLDKKIGYGQMTAVKHGNGRDWWLPVPEEIGNKIYMVLINNDSVYLHHTQQLGPEWNGSGGFQASFSPDGSKYVRYNRFHGVYIYDFDRCDGLLSNLVHFPFNETTQGIFGGCAIAPNNRYLYVSDLDYLYQFDLQAADIRASKQLVESYDGYVKPFPTKFTYIVNAPDGRMYIIPPNTCQVIHVINRPNLPAAQCDFRQHEIEFPYDYANPPIFPNHRLGPLDGSPCDTLGMNNYPLAGFRPEPSDTSSRTLWLWDISDYQPAIWHWDFGDPASGSANTSTDTNAVHTFSGPGFYTVCLTVRNAYGSNTKCKVVEVKTSAVENNSTAVEYLRVLPNPTTGMVRFPWSDSITRHIRVHDSTGRVVLSLTMDGQEMDMSELPGGVYTLRIEEKDRRYTGKVVVLPH